MGRLGCTKKICYSFSEKGAEQNEGATSETSKNDECGKGESEKEGSAAVSTNSAKLWTGKSQLLAYHRIISWSGVLLHLV